MLIDTDECGLRMFHKQWEIYALRFVWSNRGVISREVYNHVNEKLSPKTISRASIINFLEYMTRKGYLAKTEKTGKGGYHGVYHRHSIMPDEAKYIEHRVKLALEKFRKEFPDLDLKTLA